MFASTVNYVLPATYLVCRQFLYSKTTKLWVQHTTRPYWWYKRPYAKRKRPFMCILYFVLLLHCFVTLLAMRRRYALHRLAMCVPFVYAHAGRLVASCFALLDLLRAAQTCIQDICSRCSTWLHCPASLFSEENRRGDFHTDTLFGEARNSTQPGIYLSIMHVQQQQSPPLGLSFPWSPGQLYAPAGD
jgi:hypothetical protein